MANEVLTGTRMPDLSYAPDISQVDTAVRDLAGFTAPRFATASARDTAYSSWVTAGYTMASGLLCTVAGVPYRYNGTIWVQLGRDTTMGNGWLNAQTLITATTTPWQDLATVTGTSTGSACAAQVIASAWNGASGADRTIDLQVVCDGTQIGTMGGISIPLAGPRTVVRTLTWSSTPAAGAHTWKLQTRASVASAVYVESASLSVIETT